MKPKPTTITEEKSKALLRQGAEQLAWLAAQRAFTLWQEKKFRELVSFDHIDQTEQDRIFNELEVTILGALDLFFEWEASKVTSETDYAVFTFIREEIPAQFVQILEQQGIAKKHATIWRKLIDLRFREYRDNFKDAQIMTTNWQEFKNKPAILKPVWTRVQTMSISAWQHIRRGKTETHDPLWPLLRDWLVDIYALLMAMMDDFLKEKNQPQKAKSIN